MGTEQTWFDDDCARELAELGAIRPRDLARVVPQWQAERLESRRAPLESHRRTLRRVGGLAAAAVVVAAVGTGLALAAPAPVSPLRTAAACGERLAPTGAVLEAAVRRQVTHDEAVLSVTGTQTSLTVQLLDASGAVLTRPVAGEHQVSVTEHDLCPGRSWHDVVTGGARARVLLTAGGPGPRCLVLPLDARGAVAC